jgi:O-antigen/teichoic acid export membrane protein
MAVRTRRRFALVGVTVGVVLAAGSGVAGDALRLPQPLIAILGLAPLGAGLLALERGVLYGSGRHRWVAATLVAEPLVRLGVGLALALALGAAGAAAGVVAGGYVALGVAVAARRRAQRLDPPGAEKEQELRTDLRPAVTVFAFLLLALLQNQDLLLSGRLLDGPEAGHFAVLSTLGGAAAFATVTVPMVLLGRATRDPQHSLGAAVGVAAAIGGAIVVGAALLPDLVVLAFGERYAAVSGLAAMYLLAMAFFGVGRVLVAHRCATGRTRTSIVLLLVVAAAHLALLFTLGTDAAGIARSTLVATIALTAVFGLAVVVRLPDAPRIQTNRFSITGKAFLLAGGVALLAVVLRMLVARGIWVDEAITIHQAELSFTDMIDSVRTGDVHPPLHHILLWPVIRVFGTGEVAVRLPSIVFGVALVGMLYVAGRDLFDRATGQLAALLGAVAPLLVWYSQEARMYSLFMFLSVVAVWAQVMALRHGRRWFWGLYGVVAAALLWTHYFAALPLAVQQVAFGIEAVRRFRRRREGDSRFGELMSGWAMSLGIAAAALAPLVPVVVDQLAAYGERSTQVPSQVGTAAAPSVERPSIYAAIANFVWSVWGYHSDETMILLGALWPLGMLVALLLLGRGRSWNTMLLTALVVVPVAALFTVGIFKRDLFEVRYFAGAIPALVLLAARALRKLSPNRVLAAAAVGAVVMSMGAALADQQLNRSNPRIYDFEGALDEVSRRTHPRDKVLFAPLFMNRVVDYYAPDLEAKPLDLESLPGRKKAKRVFLIGSFLDMKQHSGTVGTALSEFADKRRLVGKFERAQVKVWVFK